MSSVVHDRGESQTVARMLAEAFNAHAHGPGAADYVTVETLSGHAIRLRYDGRQYVVLVAPESATPGLQAQFEDYRHGPPAGNPVP